MTKLVRGWLIVVLVAGACGPVGKTDPGASGGAGGGSGGSGGSGGAAGGRGRGGAGGVRRRAWVGGGDAVYRAIEAGLPCRHEQAPAELPSEHASVHRPR